ncbi:MAG: response regulator [Candidatus Pacearchaeota archaeon]|jgi:DNA-binding response OmpR family regulator
MSKKILILEDDSFYRQFLNLYLKRKNYFVKNFDNTGYLVNEIKENSYDVLILDADVKGKYTLEQVIEFSREFNKDARIIIYSGYGESKFERFRADVVVRKGETLAKNLVQDIDDYFKLNF